MQYKKKQFNIHDLTFCNGGYGHDTEVLFNLSLVPAFSFSPLDFTDISRITRFFNGRIMRFFVSLMKNNPEETEKTIYETFYNFDAAFACGVAVGVRRSDT